MLVGLDVPVDVAVSVVPNFQLTAPAGARRKTIEALRTTMLENSLNNVDKHILKTFLDAAENCPIQANTKRIVEDE